MCRMAIPHAIGNGVPDGGRPIQSARYIQLAAGPGKPGGATHAALRDDPYQTYNQRARGSIRTGSRPTGGAMIDELEATRNGILSGAEVGWPTISDTLAQALRNRFRMEPESRQVWTGSGAGTVAVLSRPYRAVREVLNGAWLSYTCLAPATISTPTCAGPGCGEDTRAVPCESVYRIFLCRPWRSDSADGQAATLLHEGFYIYFSFIADIGHLGNAHYYEQNSTLTKTTLRFQLHGLVHVPSKHADRVSRDRLL